MDEQEKKVYKALLRQLLGAVQDTAVALRKLIDVICDITDELDNSKQKRINKKGEFNY